MTNINQRIIDEYNQAQTLAALQQARRQLGSEIAAQDPSYFGVNIAETGQPMYPLDNRINDIYTGANILASDNRVTGYVARKLNDMGVPLAGIAPTMDMLDFTPVGTAEGLYDTYAAAPNVVRDLRDGNYSGAAQNAAIAGLGLLDAAASAAPFLKPVTNVVRGVDTGKLAADAIGTGRALSRGDAEMLAEIFSRGGTPESLSAASPNINTLDPNAWLTRIENSIPKSWLDPKYDKPQWDPISNVSSNFDASQMQPVLRSTGTLVPENALSIEDMFKRTAIPAYGDRSLAGSKILGVGDIVYDNPIRAYGGGDFMREMNTGAWANAEQQASDIAKTARSVIEAGGDPSLVYSAMGAQSGDFSDIMAQSIMNLYDPQKMNLDAVSKYDDAVRKIIPEFRGLLAPDFGNYIMNDLTGTDRWALWQAMDKSMYRDAGLPDVNIARRAMTEPRLMDAVPFDSGFTVSRPTGGLLSPDAGIDQHPSFPVQVEGAYEGGMQNVPGPIMWRNFFDARRSSGAAPAGDQRSFLMNANRIAQPIDQQMVDEVNLFNEYMRNLSDPSSPLRLWQQQRGQ